MLENDALMALTHYDTAVGLNPDHYQPHYFRASALHRMGRVLESREEFVKALALNPRHAMSRTLIGMWSDELHVDLVDSFLTIGGVALLDSGGIHIVFDEAAGAHWMVYAMAKAMWLGEPEHRRQVNGDTARAAWSSVEERECVGAMLMSYLSLRDEEKVEADPELDRIHRILKDGYFHELLMYEFASRVDPQVMMNQPREQQQRMEEFVAKYVVAKRK
jgi:tetratricopeptide (TPR) repeat protein